MKLTNGIIFIALAIILSFSLAFSINYRYHPHVCAEYFKSECVFTGKVVSVRAVDTLIGGEYFIAGHWYRIKVYKNFRGNKTKYVSIYINNDSGGYDMDAGKEYLLFAYREKDYLAIDCYGNSCLLSDAKEKIQQIEDIAKAIDGQVEGQVLCRYPKGISIQIIGDHESYSCVADSDGWFYKRVKPGKYHVLAEGGKVGRDDISYDDANKFVVYKGGCVQITFFAEKKE